jgi:GntR family transcriptional regulator
MGQSASSRISKDAARGGRVAKADSFDGQHLSRDGDAPLWGQLRLVLKRTIDAGRLQPGDRVPSESELCDRFQVSRIVVREALAQLVVDGLIYKIKGKGTFVARPRGEGEFVGTTRGFWEEMATKGRQIRTDILSQERAPSTAEERTGLRLEPGADVVRLERLYTLDGTPTILVSTALPATLVPELERVSLQNRSLYETIRQRYGLIPHRGERWIEAMMPGARAARLLGIRRSQPVLLIESITATDGGQPLEFYRAFQRTDAIRLHVLTR